MEDVVETPERQIISNPLHSTPDDHLRSPTRPMPLEFPIEKCHFPKGSAAWRMLTSGHYSVSGQREVISELVRVMIPYTGDK